MQQLQLLGKVAIKTQLKAVAADLPKALGLTIVSLVCSGTGSSAEMKVPKT